MGFEDYVENDDLEIEDVEPEYFETYIEDDTVENDTDYYESPIEDDNQKNTLEHLKKNSEKKSESLSYSEWFSFYLSIFTNNIALAELCAKKAYLDQIHTQEIEDNTEEIDNLLAKINVGLEELKKDGHKHFYLFKPDKKDIEDRLYMQNKKLKYGKVCFTLTAGRYTVGMDIPEGRYRIVAKKNSGNIYNKYYTFGEDLDAEDDDSPKIHKRLIIGDILFITDALVVELSSKKANLLQNIIRYPIGKEITLKAGNYICGDDFKSGVYDIKRIKNRGVVSFDDSGEDFGSEANELEEIKNWLFKNNDYLGISGGLIIKLVPSKNNYIK